MDKRETVDKKVFFVGLLLIFVGLIAASAVTAAIAMWLWNYLVPTLFHGPRITFWQAWALVSLLALVSAIVPTAHVNVRK